MVANCSKKYPLGYDDTQSLIVFPHNTPNNTLPVIWASNNNETSTAEILWKPLWNRKKVQDKNPKKARTTFAASNTLFDVMVNECQILKEKMSSYLNIQITEEKNPESISYDVHLNDDAIFLKIARNNYFNNNNSILVWLYKNKYPSVDASFNGIVEQNTDKVTLINLGVFLSQEKLEISFSSIKDFIKELFNEISSLI